MAVFQHSHAHLVHLLRQHITDAFRRVSRVVCHQGIYNVVNFVHVVCIHYRLIEYNYMHTFSPQYGP